MLRGAFTLASLVAAQDTDIYQREPTTELGCECKSECQTDLVVGYCNVAEFCVVKDKNCPKGKASFHISQFGYIDWCTYKPFQEYEQLPAMVKQSMLLGKARDGASGAYPGTLSVLTGLLGESVSLSFEARADAFPQKRTKYIHSVGVVGGISWTSDGNHPYKGIFEGAEYGVVRFSSANEPGKGGYTPGMGVKFLRDGRTSASFVSMYTLDGVTCDDKNFFQRDWSNHVPLTDNFGLKIVASKFWQASYCPIQIGISDLASPADGVPAERGSFPYQLIFKPAVSSNCDCMDYEACLANLAHIPVGTTLFNVEAIAAPGATPQHIGHWTLTEELAASKFGDESLFIKHQYMEEDFAIHPEWLDAISKETDCGMKGMTTERPSYSKGCSSPFGASAAVMLETDAVVA